MVELKPSLSHLQSEGKHLLTSPILFLLRFNRLPVGSVDESSFAHLSNLQVLDINSGKADLPFNGDKITDDKQLEEEEK